jgi:hypothetical protein
LGRLQMELPKETTSKQKKARTRAEKTLPGFEETPGASSSELRFPRDYIPPRKDDVKPVKLNKDGKYKLVTP